MKISALEEILGTIVRGKSMRLALETLGRDERLALPEGEEFVAATDTLARRLRGTGPALSPDDVGKPWF